MPIELPKLSIDLSAGIPLEKVLAAAFEYASTYRTTMSQENRDRGDKLWLDVLEWAIYETILRGKERPK